MGIDIEAIVNEANVDTASFDLAAVRTAQQMSRIRKQPYRIAENHPKGRLDIVGCALTNCDGANMVAIDVHLEYAAE